MTARCSGALVVVVLAGCGRPPFFIDREEALSLIVAQERDGAWTVDAKTIGESRSTDLESPDPIYVLLYDRSLADLDLVAGPLSQEPPWRLLPEPDRGFLVDDSGSVAFDELPESLAGVRINRPDPCYAIEPVDQGTLDATTLFFTASIDGKSLLSSDTGFYWAEGDAIAPATELAPDLPREAGFWHEASGELWLIDGATGRVMHGDPSSAFESAPDLPNRDRTPIFLDGSRGDYPLELFVVTSSRALYRFDGTSWEERAAPRGFAYYSSRSQVAWRGPRQAVALSGLDDRVIEDDGTSVSDVFVPELNTGTSDDAVRAVRFVDGYGPLLATERGALYSPISPGWQLLHRAPTRTQAWIIEPLGLEGVVYGGEDGVLAQYQPGASCASTSLAAQADVPIIAWLATGEQRIAIYPSVGPLLWVRARVR